MVEIDRRVLARIRGCKDPTFLEGAACTNLCEQYLKCKVKKAPLLLNTLKTSATFQKPGVDKGVIISQFNIGDVAPDGWINEIFEGLG